jgi:hypothetical protein
MTCDVVLVDFVRLLSYIPFSTLLPAVLDGTLECWKYKDIN